MMNSSGRRAAPNDAVSHNRPRGGRGILALLTGSLALTVFSAFASEKEDFPVPAGLDKITYPVDNPQTAAKVALGKQLFFDPRLSSDGKVSCASCHNPAKGWSNGEQFATGIDGLKGGRNAPTILNTTYQMFQFWDGRSGSLEDQALGPIQNPIEMNTTLEQLEQRLNAIPGYRAQFTKVFGTEQIEAPNVGRAIAAYERTILSGDAPFDRYKAGDKKALSAAAQRGMDLFFGKAHCSACHSGPNFTDNAFHNIGIGMHAKEADQGRRVVSKIEGDHGSFKTPGLRDIGRSAPYMHDGSEKTLVDVVSYYNRGGTPNDYLDEEIYPLSLTKEEQADLVTFLKDGLGSSKYPAETAPKLPE
jgi:cytochrome c peroxidase